MGQQLLDEVIKQPSPGMFDLGNSCFTDEIDYKTRIRSVVAWVDAEKHYGFGLCPKISRLPSAYQAISVSTEDLLSGKEASEVLQNWVKQHGVELPALKFCLSYQGYGVKQGEAFLLSRQEINLIKMNTQVILSAWRRLNLMMSNGTLLSSSVNKNGDVWMQSFGANAFSHWVTPYSSWGVIPAVTITW